MAHILLGRLVIVFVCSATVAVLPTAARAATTICVDVHEKSWTVKKTRPPAGKSRGEDRNSYLASGESQPQTEELEATAYLRRMMEYEVTHEKGFAAVKRECQHTIVVELYPLRDGWTVFARYSGHAREEKVEFVKLDELAQLAQRLTRALLRDLPVEETITRENVLRADTEGSLRTIGVRGHAQFGMGTSVRAGLMPTSNEVESPARDELRLLTPITLRLGYRGKFKAWGLDVFGRLNLGTQERAVSPRDFGGHVDYMGGLGLGLHFFNYLDAPGITSVYFGGGASFDLGLFSVVRNSREHNDHDLIIGGGLDVDLVVGYELMRASALHFYAQFELKIPTYIVRAETQSANMSTYLPGGLAEIGVLF